MAFSKTKGQIIGLFGSVKGSFSDIMYRRKFSILLANMAPCIRFTFRFLRKYFFDRSSTILYYSYSLSVRILFFLEVMISTADSAVLHAILNPNEPFNNNSLPSDPSSSDSQLTVPVHVLNAPLADAEKEAIALGKRRHCISISYSDFHWQLFQPNEGF